MTPMRNVVLAWAWAMSASRSAGSRKPMSTAWFAAAVTAPT